MVRGGAQEEGDGTKRRWLEKLIPSAHGMDDKRRLDMEFLAIAAPSFVQFTAEPLAGLVDTMYLGRLGRTALAGVGVAISAQYSVSKLYNDPLLRTSISLVASSSEGGEGEEEKRAALSRSISTALLLAIAVGLTQVRRLEPMTTRSGRTAVALGA